MPKEILVWLAVSTSIVTSCRRIHLYDENTKIHNFTPKIVLLEKAKALNAEEESD